MKKSFTITFCALLVTAILSNMAFAQPGPPRNRPGKDGEKKPEYPPLPNDKRLIDLHFQFVKDAEKLAEEYEKKKEFSKAKDVYGEILKLVPQYDKARVKLNTILQLEASAQQKTFRVDANKDWQDSGVIAEEGKPITIRAAGKWTFNLKLELGPDGIQIPKELREYNLGCLVGAIDTGNPKEFEHFAIGSQKQFIAKKTGRLVLRMYDSASNDNEGFLDIEITGSFGER